MSPDRIRNSIELVKTKSDKDDTVEENVNPFELLADDKKEMVLSDIESPAKEMKDSDFPSARRSISLINPQKIKMTDTNETDDDKEVVMEYRPLVDVFEIESYKEYNRI